MRDDDKVLKDGQTLKVRMTVMDAAQRAAVAVLNGHRPRPGLFDASQREASAERQAAYDARISEAWRNPTSMVAPAINADERSAVKVIPTISADALDTIQAGAQRRYNARIENAWRYPETGA